MENIQFIKKNKEEIGGNKKKEVLKPTKKATGEEKSSSEGERDVPTEKGKESQHENDQHQASH